MVKLEDSRPMILGCSSPIKSPVKGSAKDNQIISDDTKEISTTMSKQRRAITINRPIIPHLHLVNLRPEEALIDKVLFKQSKTPPTCAQKTIFVIDKEAPKE